MKIVEVVFQKTIFFFLMWTTLHFEGISKTNKKKKKKVRKRETGNICKGTLDIEFEQGWSVGLDATLHERQKIKNYFSSFKDFSEKADSVILLGFECTINPQNLIKIVGAIFEEIQIFNFFLMWTTLNFRGRGKNKKNGSRYLPVYPRYRIWTSSVDCFRLYVRRRSDGQTHTDIFYKTHF